MKRANLIHIGTSGWEYPHWKGPFYPDGIRSDGHLAFYADSFHTVEVNNSFYNLPSEKTLAAWRDTVPDGFTFAVKASRYITHMKKLKEPQKAVSRFLDRVSVLGEKLGPILFQLPPKWRANPQRLKEFCGSLPADFRYTFEFRDPSWFNDEIYEILTEAGAAFCIFHLSGLLSPKKVTADFTYVRLHGPGPAYQGSYSPGTLSGWAGTFSAWARKHTEVYCYFDNDQSGYAALNALKLNEMLS